MAKPSWIGSLQLFLMYAPGVVVGHLFDAGYLSVFLFHQISAPLSDPRLSLPPPRAAQPPRPDRRLHPLRLFGLHAFAHPAGPILPGQSERSPHRPLLHPIPPPQVFLAQGIGIGLSVGLLFLPSLSIVSHHFRTRRALATGIVVSGASCGGIVFPVMLNHLFANTKMGFANGVRTSGALIAALLALANCIMRTRLPPKRRSLRAVFSPQSLKRIAGDGPYMWSVAGWVSTNVLYIKICDLSHNTAAHSARTSGCSFLVSIVRSRISHS